MFVLYTYKIISNYHITNSKATTIHLQKNSGIENKKNMAKFTTSNNSRAANDAYKSGTPFDGSKTRLERIKARKFKAAKRKYFARKRKQHAQEEATVMQALRANDETALQAIAMSVALFALSVE